MIYHNNFHNSKHLKRLKNIITRLLWFLNIWWSDIKLLLNKKIICRLSFDFN